MASSGHAAMATAVQGSQWNSSCSRSSIATRPSPSLEHTTVSALVPWVSTSGEHRVIQLHPVWEQGCSTGLIKMLSHETLEHNELRADKSLEHKKKQLELLGKMSMHSNKCSPYMSCSKRYILFYMCKFCYQSLKI